MDDDLTGRLNDVLDIIAAAEMQFARTEAHHAYYDNRHAAVAEAIAVLATLSDNRGGETVSSPGYCPDCKESGWACRCGREPLPKTQQTPEPGSRGPDNG